MTKRVAIIGAGISGLSLANMLKDNFAVDIYENNEKPGGLVRCERVSDNLYHKVGGHVFNSKNPEVLKWFWSFFDKDKEFVKAKRNAKILLNGKYIGYPIENHLFELEKATGIKIIKEIITGSQTGNVTIDNFKSFLQYNFGETLYQLYFGPYNKKIWQTDLEKVSLEWLRDKLPMPNVDQVLEYNIYRTEERDMVHSTFYYPLTNGSQFIIDRLSNGINIYMNCPVTNLKKEKDQYLINNKKYDYVVYTGDIRVLPELFHEQDLTSFKSRISSLLSQGTSNVFCECDPNELSWLYLPEEKIKAHRIIYTGNFATSNNRGTDRITCTVEFSGKQDKEAMMEELPHLPGNLKYLAHHYEQNSYVIQTENTDKLIKEVKEVLAQSKIFLLGRFAEWQYYNMDKCIESAFGIASQIKSNSLVR